MGIKADAVLVGSVGRLKHVKGYDILIDAFGQIPDKNAQLVLIGDGSEKESLKNLVKHRRIENRVHFVGHQNDVSNWLAALDIYVNSSRSEGMSQSIVEAMSIGLPIVASDVGDAKRMLLREPKSSGVICDPNEPSAMAQVIQSLVADTTLRNELGRNSLACHRNYYTESIFNHSFREMYEQVVGKSTNPQPNSSSSSTSESSLVSKELLEAKQ